MGTNGYPQLLSIYIYFIIIDIGCSIISRAFSSWSTIWQFHIAIEHGHWNCEFSHWTWWFSIDMKTFARGYFHSITIQSPSITMKSPSNMVFFSSSWCKPWPFRVPTKTTGHLHIHRAADFMASWGSRKLKPGDVLLEVAGKPCLNFVLLGSGSCAAGHQDHQGQVESD